MRVCNRAIHVLLMIAVVFCGAPSWEHSHAAGDRPHTHRSHAEHAAHSHGLSHADNHSHDDADEHSHGDAGIGECHAHRHVTLFGISFTLPLDSNDQTSGEGQWTYLVSATPVIEANHAFTHASPLATVSLESGQRLSSPPGFCCKAASAAPLCDAARHERSGVLLV